MEMAASRYLDWMARFARVCSIRWRRETHWRLRSSASCSERISYSLLSRRAVSVRRWTWIGSLRSTRTELCTRWGFIYGRGGASSARKGMLEKRIYAGSPTGLNLGFSFSKPVTMSFRYPSTSALPPGGGPIMGAMLGLGAAPKPLTGFRVPKPFIVMLRVSIQLYHYPRNAIAKETKSVLSTRRRHDPRCNRSHAPLNRSSCSTLGGRMSIGVTRAWRRRGGSTVVKGGTGSLSDRRRTSDRWLLVDVVSLRRGVECKGTLPSSRPASSVVVAEE
jgi:hypothetical protein